MSWAAGVRTLAPKQARCCVVGAVLFDDFSARDLLRTELADGMGPAKGKDFATALGPWLVTVDELDHDAIELTIRVNGQVWSSGSTSSAMWSVGELVAWASIAEPLRPGEVLGSGTLGGGCGFELDRRLAPGMKVELSSPRLGVLRNRLAARGVRRVVASRTDRGSARARQLLLSWSVASRRYQAVERSPAGRARPGHHMCHRLDDRGELDTV